MMAGQEVNVGLELLARQGVDLIGKWTGLTWSASGLGLSGAFRFLGETLVSDAGPVYDGVVKNQPFHNQADLHHVLHALKFLAPKGRLVSVLAAGVRSRSNQLAKYFRAMVRDRGGWFEDLPEDAFEESGTLVQTVVVVSGWG